MSKSVSVAFCLCLVLSFFERFCFVVLANSRCFSLFGQGQRNTCAQPGTAVHVHPGLLHSECAWQEAWEWILVWLQCYGECARLCHAQGFNRFSLVPKLHFIHHTALEVIHQSARASWAVNPLALSVQQQEDWVGRPSRVSRRVNPRKLMDRLADRTLICCLQAMEEADTDRRGLRGTA